MAAALTSPATWVPAFPFSMFCNNCLSSSDLFAFPFRCH
jgi:hypothetical protein